MASNAAPPRERPQELYIFTEFTIDQLVIRLGYTDEYLFDLRAGRKPITDRFKRRAGGILGLPQETLFSVAQPKEGGDNKAEEGHEPSKE